MSRLLTLFVVVLSGGILLPWGTAPLVRQAHGQVDLPVQESGLCTPCHTSNAPTPDEPCLRLCLRDATLPAMPDSAPASLPDVVILDELEDLYLPVPFDHKGHAEMAEMTTGCLACHHHTPEGAEHPTCRSCHDTSQVKEDMKKPGLKGAYHRQCMSCHREWSHDTACNVCHLPKTRRGEPPAVYSQPSLGGMSNGNHVHPPVEIKPTYVYRTAEEPWPVVTFHHVDHVESFGLRCVDCHRGQSCTQCHDEQAARDDVHYLRDCRSCHKDRECGFCHDTEERPSFDHARVSGWTLEPYHSKVACAACHGSDGSSNTPSTVCHSCHIHQPAGSMPSQVTSLTLGENTEGLDCFSCHEDMKVRFDNAAVVHGPAAGATRCTSCHDSVLSTSPRPQKQSELCLSCHDKPIDTPDGRSLKNIAALLTASPNHHGPIREGNCCACHQPHASEHKFLLAEEYPAEFYAPFETDRYKLCFSCHMEERVLREAGTGLTGFRDGDRNLHWLHVNRDKGRSCRACHAVHASHRPFHMRESVPFGNPGWSLPINFEQTADGGTCAPGCHAEESYRRSTTTADAG